MIAAVIVLLLLTALVATDSGHDNDSHSDEPSP
jgi:hypothetical protein